MTASRPLRAVAVALLALAVLVLATWWGTSRVGGDPLDPDGPDLGGARALARVLERNGVEVEVVRRLDRLRELETDDRTTLVVTSTELLGGTALDQLRDRAQRSLVVLVDPTPDLLDALDVQAYGADAPELSRTCAPGPIQGGPDLDSLDLAGLELRVQQAVLSNLPGCWSGVGGTALSVTEDDLVLLGVGEILSNDRITAGDNAAAALRLLGSRERLVWYVPSGADLGAEEGAEASPASLVPRWLAPTLWVLALAFLALALWRGRRLGPLAVEPLPISVRAIESTLGRGRLQQRSRDRAHAARTLRLATLRRLARSSGGATTVGLGTADHASTDAVLAHVAQRSGRDPGTLRALLHPDAPAPTTDDALVHLARALTALEEEVLQP